MKLDGGDDDNRNSVRLCNPTSLYGIRFVKFQWNQLTGN